MLKKLRVKLIAVIMIIVSITVGIIFGMLYYSTSTKLSRDNKQLLERIVMNPTHSLPPSMEKDKVQLPYFSVFLDGEGNIVALSGDYFDMTDEETIISLVVQCEERGKESGTINGDKFEYLCVRLPQGHLYAFIDISSEKSILNNLIKNFIVIGVIIVVIFFIISILFSSWAIKPVEQAWKQQKQFIADASHELKTPLTVILTDAELLRTPGCSEEDRTKLSDSIITMSSQMRGLVDSMLELARIDSGNVYYEKENISFSDIVSDAVMMFEPVYFEKDIVFLSEIEEKIMVHGNKSQLMQLVDILLDNARKYTEEKGSVEITLVRGKHNQCTLCVANTGEQISREDLKNIFKRFYRTDKVRKMNHSYGLGLSIADSIVKEHHGRIWAESKDGYNRFSIELPLR